MRHLKTFLLAAAIFISAKAESQNAFPFIDRSQQYWSDWIASNGGLNFSNRNGGYLTLSTNAQAMIGLNHAPASSSLSIGVPVGGGVDFYMPHAYTSGDNFKFTFGDGGASSFIQIYFSQTAVLHNYYGYYIENAGGVPASLGALGSLSVGLGGNMDPVSLSGATLIAAPTSLTVNQNGLFLGSSNWFSGTLHGAQISADAFTNRASSGGKIQITDANGKLIDATVGAGLLLNGNTISTNGQTTGGGGDTGVYWKTNGNTGTINNSDYLGTADTTDINISEGGSMLSFFNGTRANIIAHGSHSSNAGANSLLGVNDGVSILNGNNNVVRASTSAGILGEANSISNSLGGSATFGSSLLMDTKARTGVTSTRPSIGMGYLWNINDAGVFVFGDKQQPALASYLATTWIDDAAYWRVQHGFYVISGGLNVGSTNLPASGAIIATNYGIFGATNLYATTNIFEVDWTNGQAITVNATNGAVNIPKALTARHVARVTTITSSATPTVNSDNCDCVTITALAAAITSMTSNLTGTPNNFDKLEYRIKDDGTARAITWGASFVSGPATLPTTTTISKALHVYFEWDSVQSKWVCMTTGSDA